MKLYLFDVLDIWHTHSHELQAPTTILFVTISQFMFGASFCNTKDNEQILVGS